ncbi:MAG TPA: PspC domain-containing protein [Streptosporangiaceae bacterium]|nr:PspC domain-containing protein [Streptosporangiaceae bacterium]
MAGPEGSAPPYHGGVEPPESRPAPDAEQDRHGAHRLFARVATGPGSKLPWRRERDRALAGGVLAGLSTKTGIDLTALRIVVAVISLLTSGYVLAAYVLTWLLLPASNETGSIASRAASDKRGIGLAAALATVLGAVLIGVGALDIPWINALAWPLVISACGLVLIWRNSEPGEQQRMQQLAEPVLGNVAGQKPGRIVPRIAVGAGLLAAGLTMLLVGHERVQLLVPLGGVVLLLGAIAVVLGPWWMRIARDLVEERQARIRAEERADMAARVHDSVLQTLALIQRRASDPHQVVRLARVQERELRAWLFEGKEPGSLQADGVAAGVRQIQQDVEARHGITVDAVTVGDCELDEELGALLAAAREATVNAAKWSGADTVSLFAEVEPDAVSVYVRDRGCGFDPDAVPADRKGLAESVRARVARRGGSASVRSAPGEGTEVSLTMPRQPARRP